MDQVRAIAKVIWEQRFWVLSVLGVLIGVLCWSMATGDLDSKFKSRSSAINSAFNSVKSIASEANHPNTEVVEEDRKQVAIQREAVYQVWKDLYERQSDILTWPEALGKDFIDYIGTLKFGDTIKLAMRGTYQNYIEKRFDGLLEIVKAQEIEGQPGGGGRGGRGGYVGRGAEGYPGTEAETEDEDYLVRWLDQDQLRQKLYFGNKPTTVQIWVTQEDLWVYEALLNVIARTNGARKATRYDNTAIRVIESLEVGSGAAPFLAQVGDIYLPPAAGGGVGGMGMGEYAGRGGEFGGEYGGGEYGGRGGGEYGGEYGGRGGYGGEFGGEYGGRGGMLGEDGAGLDAALLASRYLDDTGAPATSADLATAGTQEYRQLPIHMMLIMDQRWLPELLRECANSPLPVEVKQVRINPSNATQGFGANSGYNNRVMQEDPDPSLAEIEIKGSVYIYKEPDESVIGTQAAPDSQLADVGTELP